MYSPKIANNSHLAKIETHFGSIETGKLKIAKNPSFLFICFTNRCGSNYLAEILASGGHYNLAGERLNWNVVIEESTRRRFASFGRYFEFLASRTQKSGTFIVKIAVTQIELLCRAGILPQIIDRSTFVLIERGDKLGQAISHALAVATGRFTSRMAGTMAPEDVPYSRKKIERLVDGIANSYREYDMFFGRNGLTPVSIVYEQLIADPALFSALIARSAGLGEFALEAEKLKLERQANAVNQKWREMFLAGE